MTDPTAVSSQFPRVNLKAAGAYVWLAGLAYVALLVYVALRYRPEFALIAALAPVAVFIALVPRLALLQFMVALFVEFTVLPAGPVELLDLSALLLIASAVIDTLLREPIPRTFPRLFGNYAAIALIMIVTGLVGYWPELMPRRLITYGVLVGSFLAVYRLSHHFSVRYLLNALITITALNAAYVVTMFLLSGGSVRVFGFTKNFFDDQAMTLLPVVGAMYLWTKEKAGRYLVAFFLIFLGLVATQSRAPILIGVFVSGVILFLSYRRASQLSVVHVVRKARTLTRSVLALSVLLIIIAPGLFETVWDRFELLLSTDHYDTFWLRLTLWSNALRAFLDNPIFGLGPGGYYHLDQLYAVKLSPYWIQVRGFGAHNLLLHFLADMGLLGAAGLLALVVNHFRLARRNWLNSIDSSLAVSAALYAWGILFVVTTLLEAAWMWGQMSFLGVLLAALVSRQFQVTQQHGDQQSI